MKKYFLLSAILFTPALIYILMSKGTHGVRRLDHSGIYVCPLFAELSPQFCDTSQVTVLHFGGAFDKKHLHAWVNLHEAVYHRLRKTRGLRFITLTTLPSVRAKTLLKSEVKFAHIAENETWSVIFANPDIIDRLANHTGVILDSLKGSPQVLLLDRSGEVRKGLRNDTDTEDGLRHDASSFSALKKGLLEDIKALFKEYYYAYKKE